MRDGLVAHGPDHDLGKFRPGFQAHVRLDPDNAHVEGRALVSADKTHSAAGALHALAQFKARHGEAGRRAGWLLAHLIAAHHAGLYDCAALAERLHGRSAADSERERREAVDACAATHPGLAAPGLPGALANGFARRLPGMQEVTA
jgi:CRISPR-associated endonuclease/helicase Cas3